MPEAETLSRLHMCYWLESWDLVFLHVVPSLSHSAAVDGLPNRCVATVFNWRGMSVNPYSMHLMCSPASKLAHTLELAVALRWRPCFGIDLW